MFEISRSTYSSDMCESSVQAFLGSLVPREVTLWAYGPGGRAGAVNTFPLSSNAGGGGTDCRT